MEIAFLEGRSPSLIFSIEIALYSLTKHYKTQLLSFQRELGTFKKAILSKSIKDKIVNVCQR